MHIQEINTIARYESRMITRGVLWKIFLFVSVACIIYALYPRNDYYLWNKIALNSSIPFAGAFYFNLIQVLFIIFIATNQEKRQRMKSALEVMNVYPPSNSFFFLGRILGIFRSFFFLNILVILVTATVHLLTYPVPFSLFIYLFYFVTLIIPTFVFTLGLSLLVAYLVRHLFLSIAISVTIMTLVYLYLPEMHCGSLDPWARTLPNSFSNFAGHVNLFPYLLQRCIYLLWGVGFLCLTVLGMHRIPSYLREKWYNACSGIFVLLLGILLLHSYLNLFYHNEKIRDEYRAVFFHFQDYPLASVLTHDITYLSRDAGFSATSKLTLQNLTKEPINQLILFLNPGLTITSIECGQKQLSFRKEYQVVIIDYCLQPDEKGTLLMHYEGDVDENICYLDIPAKTFYNTKNNNNGIQYHGKRFAFCSKNYTLLYPECLWYPVSVPPVNLHSPLEYQMDFTVYSLSVKNMEGKIILSQGHKDEGDIFTSFRSFQPLPGISLCIGDYLRKSIRVDSIPVELYYHPQSQFMVDEYKDWNLVTGQYSPDATASHMYSFAEELILQGKYPFERLTFIETPVSFVGYPRWWKKDSPLTQPELAFIPERVATQIYNPPFFYEKSSWRINRYLEPGELVSNIIQKFLAWYFQDEKVNFISQTREFTGFIYSRQYPGINSVIRQLIDMKDGSKLMREEYSERFERAVMYFDRHSLKEAIYDSTLDKHEFQNWLQYKITDLRSWISATIDWFCFERLLLDFSEEYKFQVVDFEILRQKYLDEFDFDLSALLDKSYFDKGVPTLILKDIKHMKLESDPEVEYVKLHFKVYNPSKTDGIVTVSSAASHAGENFKLHNYIIEAGGCKEIKEVFNYTSQQFFHTNLSRNIPSCIIFNLSNAINSQNGEYTRDTTQGIFDIAASSFFVAPGEIIVDNTDDGFQVIGPNQKRIKLANLIKKQDKKYAILSEDLSRWKEVIGMNYYGDYIKSAFCKESGTGNYRAEWNATLPREGMYELFAYCVPIKRVGYIANNVPSMTSYYTIRSEKESREVILDRELDTGGWISLGKYNFLQNARVVVALDDRAGDLDQHPLLKGFEIEPAYMQQIVTADAIKWVYIGE